jgi:hypothetical protein
MSDNKRLYESNGVEYNIDLLGGEAVKIFDHLEHLRNEIEKANNQVIYYTYAANTLLHTLEALLTDEAVLGGE